MLAAALHQALERLVHLRRGLDAGRRGVEHRHQAITQGLDDAPAALAHAARRASSTVCVMTEVASALPRRSKSDVLPRKSANSTVRSAISVTVALYKPEGRVREASPVYRLSR